MIDAIAKWSVKNRVTVNIAMILILVAGAISLVRLKKESFPEFSLDMIFISVSYPGASPEEIEEGICVKIEEAIKGVVGIKEITSTSIEGMGSVTAELESNADPRKVLDEIETEVDRIETFPEESKEPVVQELTLREPVMYVALYGNAPEISLRKLAEKVRDDLTATRAITQATLSGVRDYEISIEVGEAELRRYGITFDQVADAVKRASLDLPGGEIKAPSGELSLRTKAQRYTGREFESVPVITMADGTIIRLSQIANIIDGFEDTTRKIRFNGKPAVIVNVLKTSEQDILDIANAVQQYLAQNNDELPTGIETAIFFDQSEMVRSRLNLLLKNGVQGLVLVFISLALFLQFRLSFWVSMGIPISFMGGFWVLGARGDSLNMISLFAFIMVLGLVVDDAIIVGENIFRRFRKGLAPVEACIEGTSQVGWPVIMTILTTIVAFMPLLFISGIMGKFIAIMPIAIIATLLFSLFEALFILPAHLAHSLESQEKRALKKEIEEGLSKIGKFRETAVDTAIERYYAPALKWVLNNRYTVLAMALAILLVTVGMIRSGRVPFVFFPKPESDWLVAKVIFPYGTSVQTTEKAIKRIENAVQEVNSEFAQKRKNKNDKIIQQTFTLVGEIMQEGWYEGEYGSHVGEIWLELMPSEKRGIHYTKILNRWRELSGEIPGVEELIFTTPVMGPGGVPIEMQLSGNDFETLENVAEEIKKEIAKYPGTFDIADDFRPGKPELRFNTKPSAKVLGITVADLARQVRQGFYGEESLRVQRGRDDVKVMVRYTEDERHNMGAIQNMRIRTPAGDAIPLHEVAQVVQGRGYSAIHRIDRLRTISVTADVDEAVANAKKIIEDLQSEFLPELERKYPDVKIAFGGQEESTQEAISALARGFSIALLAIFCLLATQFRSYIQPVIVMTAIPFGMIGAVAGHIIFGEAFTIMSLFGVVALAGIVVNDSLVLIDFINQSLRAPDGTRRRYISVFQAAFESGKKRFRAVLLTTVTTFAGLFPILMETSFQALFLKPMVVSITFGLLFATLLTLLLIPALYMILDDVLNVIKPKQQ